MTSDIRSPLAVTYETWKALFLREAITRLAIGRTAVWILLEPVAQMVFLVILFSVMRMLTASGMEISIWIMSGFLSYNIFRITMMTGMTAVKTSKVLFTYRQVKPVDTVIVKAGMEFFLEILVAIILFSGAAVLGIQVIPTEPLTVLAAVLGMWLIGLGWALMLSVLQDLVPESVEVVKLTMTPVYMCSGVIFPTSSLPSFLRDWLILNPLLHGVEAVRAGFSSAYHTIPELSLTYVYGNALVYLFFGLALQAHFANRLKTL